MGKDILILDELNTSASLAIMRNLGRRGLSVGIICPKGHIASYSKYCSKRIYYSYSSGEKKNEYVNLLLQVVRSKKYVTLYVCEDHLMEIVYGNIGKIKKYVNVVFPENTLSNIAFNKRESYQYIKNLGVPIPDTIFPKDRNDIFPLKEKVKFPLVVKGEKGTASLFVRYANDFNQLLESYKELSELENSYDGKPMVQEYLNGDGYLVHAFCSKGKVLSICIHKKLHQIPVNGGITSKGITVGHEELKEYTVKILENLNWSGLIKMDFILDRKNNKFKFIEMDPRVSASIDIVRCAGTDMMGMAWKLAMDEDIKPNLSFRKGIKYTWVLPKELLYIFAKPQIMFELILSFFNKDEFFNLQMTDPLPDVKNFIHTLKIIFKSLFKKKLWRGEIKL